MEICNIDLTCLHLASNWDSSPANLPSLCVKNVYEEPFLFPRAVRPIRCT